MYESASEHGDWLSSAVESVLGTVPRHQTVDIRSMVTLVLLLAKEAGIDVTAHAAREALVAEGILQKRPLAV